jgi:hypothetical protein
MSGGHPQRRPPEVTDARQPSAGRDHAWTLKDRPKHHPSSNITAERTGRPACGGGAAPAQPPALTPAEGREVRAAATPQRPGAGARLGADHEHGCASDAQHLVLDARRHPDRPAKRHNPGLALRVQGPACSGAAGPSARTRTGHRRAGAGPRPCRRPARRRAPGQPAWGQAPPEAGRQRARSRCSSGHRSSSVPCLVRLRPDWAAGLAAHSI